MTTEIPGQQRHSRRRRHFRGYRRFKVVLLALGITGLAVGAMLLGWYALRGNVKLLYVGIFYLFASIILLGVRGVIAYLGQLRND